MQAPGSWRSNQIVLRLGFECTHGCGTQQYELIQLVVSVCARMIYTLHPPLNFGYIMVFVQLLCGELTRPLFLNGGVVCETKVTLGQRRYDMRHEMLTQRAPFCIGAMAKRGTLSQHFVTHVVPPLTLGNQR